jgi:hypothetical protein
VSIFIAVSVVILPKYQQMPAESASSPLPALTSSPAPSVHSSSTNDEAGSDCQAQSSDVEGSSNNNLASDPTYQTQSQVAFTSTLTLLKNKPFANRSISASSASNLMHSSISQMSACSLVRRKKWVPQLQGPI